MSGLYVYALIAGPASSAPPEVGLQGEPVRLLDWGGVLAAAGEIAAPPALTREALAAHDAVVRRLAAQAPAILPARFGQWAADPSELAAGVAARRVELGAALALVAGCVQMTLRLFASGKPVEAGEAAGGPGSGSRSGTGPGSLYLEGRRRQLAAELPPGVLELRRALAPLLRAERLELHGEPPLLATAHDLVSREQAERYRQTVAELAAAAAGWRAHVSGPWPPYAFAPGVRG
jgi:hypothetical protein